MKAKIGIDVSEHNGSIDWAKVKGHIDFAMLRAGYGHGNIDKFFRGNMIACEGNKIPFGAYWFSYALNVTEAVAEAEYICRELKGHNVQYPVAFDFEYASYNYAEAHGVKLSKKKMLDIAEGFLDRVKAKGYTPILYTNPNYIEKWYKPLLNKYDIWLACWSANKPSRYPAQIWQKGIGSAGTVPGIYTKVDLNECYKDYQCTYDKEKEIAEYRKKAFKLYDKLSDDIIDGKYGAGLARIEAISHKGYDVRLAQELVNIKIKYM